MSPEELGKKLLAEVEEVGLDEILHSLQLDEDKQTSNFGLSVLDDLIRAVTEAKALSIASPKAAPILELMSLLPGDGKTHLLYHLTAEAVLPKSFGGRQAAVIIFDTDGRFSVSRLAQQTKKLILAVQPESTNVEDIILQSLRHVHVFCPQSLSSTITTITSLQTYLFNPTAHYSFDRAIAFIALDSASAFYWQTRAETEDAALIPDAKTPTGYVQLAAALKNTSRIFNTPIIFTTWYLGPTKKPTTFGGDLRSFRPSLPPPWQSLATIRLVVKRAEVRKLPAEISVEEAIGEAQKRQKVVEQGKFECFINEWGLDERTLQRLQQGVKMGFEFFVTAEGVRVDEGGAS